jgi:hypothetical protein
MAPNAGPIQQDTPQRTALFRADAPGNNVSRTGELIVGML